MCKTGVLVFALTLAAWPASADWKDDILAAHNEVRATVHVPPLVWSDRLAAQAADWARFLAKTGSFEHSPNWMRTGGGKNLLFWGGSRFEPGDMVGAWSDEAAWYRGGPYRAAVSGQPIGHYTQIVWRQTTQVGCAMAAAPDKVFVERDYLVCRYSPPGNILGRLPY